MRTRFAVHALFALLLTVCMAHSAMAISVIGNNPFHQPPLTSVEDFQNMVVTQKDDIKKGFEIAGIGPVYDSFMAQIGDAEITPVEYQKGETMQWMFYRKKGKGPVRVDKVVVWEGDTPLKGYEFFIDHEGQRYTFMVPLICGNIALKDITNTPPPVVVPPPVEEKPVEQTPPPVAQAAAPKLMPWVADIGLLYQVDPATYLIARIGYEHYLNDNISVIGMIGGAPKLEGTDGAGAFLIDAFANYNFSSAWVGLGLGAWISTGDNDLDAEDSDLDLILNFGKQVYEKPEKYKLSIYGEVRSAVDELSDFDLYGQVGAGLRIHF